MLEHRALSAGIGALFGFSILATCSGLFNFLFVDPNPLKFYAYTVVKFWGLCVPSHVFSLRADRTLAQAAKNYAPLCLREFWFMKFSTRCT